MSLRAAFVAVLLFFTAPTSASERALEKQVVIDASVDQVWDAWTTRAGIQSFFAPDAEIDARVDGAFHIFINPYAEPGAKGADTMRYLALQPKSMLSFDWNAPPSIPATRGQRTFVVLRFAPRGDQTVLTLFHTGWGDANGVDGKAWEETYAYFDKAWDGVLGSLQRRFAPGGKPVDWTEWNERMKRASAPR